jgi:hypothetical protein
MGVSRVRLDVCVRVCACARVCACVCARRKNARREKETGVYFVGAELPKRTLLFNHLFNAPLSIFSARKAAPRMA